MVIKQSKDGKFIAGYINYRDDKPDPKPESTPEEPSFEEVLVAFPELPENDVWTNALRALSEWTRNAYLAEAERAGKKAQELEEETEELKKKRIRLKKWRHFFKNTIGEHMLVYGLIGLLTGIIIGIDAILTWHGPTVTFVGTLLAIVVYLGVGLFYGGAFAFFARFFNMQAVEDINKIIDDISEEISDTTSKYFEKLEEQKHFLELASEENLL